MTMGRKGFDVTFVANPVLNVVLLIVGLAAMVVVALVLFEAIQALVYRICVAGTFNWCKTVSSIIGATSQVVS